MDINKIEATVLKNTTDEAAVAQVLELNDLQLAAVGGGSGDVVFA